jgi:hypothetical protein
MAAGQSDGVGRAIAIVGALGGTASLVAAGGGAITWARFHQAGLPADQVVAATPNAELVTVGAVALVTYAVLGALAVAAAFRIDRYATPGKPTKISVAVLAVVAVATAVWFSEPSPTEAVLAAIVTLTATAVVWFAVHKALERRTAPGKLPVAAGVALVVMLGLSGAALWKITGEDWVGVMAALAGALAVALLTVAKATGTHFRWYGVAVFLAVLVFGGVMSTLRTASATKLQPAAVLLKSEAGGGGIFGLYVTETSDRIYLADVDNCVRKDLVLAPVDQPVGKAGRLIEVPRASVRSLAIGVRRRLREAKARAPQLLAALQTPDGAATAKGALPTVTAAHPCAGEGVVDLTERKATLVEPGRAARLARHFQPILKFDSGEHWRPLNAERLLAERDRNGRPRHAVCALTESGAQSEHQCEPLAGVADLTDEQSAARVIDFAGSRLNGDDYRPPEGTTCPGEQPAGVYDCDSGPAAAMYYRVTTSGDRTYVDYWWLLRFNDFDRQEAGRDVRSFCERQFERAVIGCFNHEGDWEGVTVVSARGADDKLAFVDMASHEGVFRYAAAELRREGSRVDVFSARGSHASYPRACATKCKQVNGRLPETNTDGEADWGANETCTTQNGCLIPLPEKSFNAFAGRWGSPVCEPSGCVFAAGPKSPSRQRRYRRPWCFTAPGPQLTCDGTPPPPPKAPPTPPPPAPPPATPAAP